MTNIEFTPASNQHLIEPILPHDQPHNSSHHLYSDENHPWQGGIGRRLRVLGIAVLASVATTSFDVTSSRADRLNSMQFAVAKPQAIYNVLKLKNKYNITNLGPGAWSWFADQKSLHYDEDGINEDVTGWAAQNGDVDVASVNQVSGLENLSILDSGFWEDDHADPALLVEPDGDITAYWSVHDGTEMYYQTTQYPGNITSWQPRQQLPFNTAGDYGYTYPNPVILSSEGDKEYLFWRGGNWEPTYSTIMPGGNWTPAQTLINVVGQRPYLKVATNGKNVIGLAFSTGHPDNYETDIAYMAIKNDNLYNADGQLLQPLDDSPVVPSNEEIVYNAKANHNIRSWIMDTALDSKNNPVILYTLYPKSGAQYWYARWNGKKWDKSFITAAGPTIEADEPHYVGGAVLDHSDPNLVYLSTKIGANWQIELWQTANDGTSWTEAQLTSGNSNSYRPVLAQNLPGANKGPATSFLTMNGVYNSYTDFHTNIYLYSIFKVKATENADLKAAELPSQILNKTLGKQ